MADHRYREGCACFRCALINLMVHREAVASVAMSHDPQAQTIAVGGRDTPTLHESHGTETRMTDHDPLHDMAPIGLRDDECVLCYKIRLARADERARVAAAIEARAETVTAEEGRWQQSDFGIMVGLSTAARIARSGGGDES